MNSARMLPFTEILVYKFRKYSDSRLFSVVELDAYAFGFSVPWQMSWMHTRNGLASVIEDEEGSFVCRGNNF